MEAVAITGTFGAPVIVTTPKTELADGAGPGTASDRGTIATRGTFGMGVASYIGLA